jgi:hypothetical protein
MRLGSRRSFLGGARERAVLILGAVLIANPALATVYGPGPHDSIMDQAPEQGGSFGSAIASEGSIIAVGTPGKSVTSFESGSVQLFERGAAGWAHSTTLVPSTTLAQSMGLDVALSGSTLAATTLAPHRVFTFERLPNGTWVSGPDAVPVDGGGDAFGQALSLDGDRLAVGAPYDDTAGFNVGAVYLFERQPDGSWAQTQKITPAGASSYALFGHRLSLRGDVLVVGAPDNGSPIIAGAAFVFEHEGGAWVQTSRLVAPDKRQYDQYGAAVGVAGDTIVVGAPFRDGVEENAGGVYVYKRQLGGWGHVLTLENPAPSSNNQYGGSVAFRQGVLVVGAPGADVGATNTGAAYVYDMTTGLPVFQTRLLPEPVTAFGTLGAAIATDGRTIAAGSPARGTVYVYESMVSRIAQGS